MTLGEKQRLFMRLLPRLLMDVVRGRAKSRLDVFASAHPSSLVPSLMRAHRTEASGHCSMPARAAGSEPAVTDSPSEAS